MGRSKKARTREEHETIVLLSYCPSKQNRKKEGCRVCVFAAHISGVRAVWFVCTTWVQNDVSRAGFFSEQKFGATNYTKKCCPPPHPICSLDTKLMYRRRIMVFLSCSWAIVFFKVELHNKNGTENYFIVRGEPPTAKHKETKVRKRKHRRFILSLHPSLL